MYAVVNLGAFAVVALVGREHARNRIADYRGLFAERPLTALALAFFLLCLAGLPPGVVGLFAKVVVFQVALEAGLGWLAVVMAVNVVVALYYYLQWTAVLFAKPEPAEAPAPAEVAAAPALPAVPAPLRVTVAATLVLGVVLSGAPELVLRFASTTLF
jgi:NADH-quinone oxidoreductase subunit N